MSSSSLPVTGFGIVANFADEQAVLAIRGQVDILTAPELGALLDAAIASGHLSVVLDMADLDLIDTAGIAVIVGTDHRLAASGGELTIRSPSAGVRRILDVAGLAEMVRPQQAEHIAPRLGAEQPVDPHEVRAGAASYGRSRHPRRVTFVPADADMVDAALRLVVALARATVGGADGVSVSLRRHGRLATVAASNQTVLDMDADQYATGEGPCVDASVNGRWFHAESLADETRWPAFTPRAQTLGINAILSSPLLARERPVGALNIYSRTAAAFSPREQDLASVFATEASAILTDAGVDVTDDQLSGRLGEALRTRQLIAQAEGVIMERSSVSGEDAYSMLRRLSVGTGRPLRDEAESVVSSARQRRGIGSGPAEPNHG